MKTRTIWAAISVAIGTVMLISASGLRPTPPQTPPMGTPKQVKAAADLWTYITEKNNYKEWPLFPGEPGIREGESEVHGKFVRIFVNDKAMADIDSFPDGSIIVKENFMADDENTLGAVTVMYRDTGYDPDHHDWFWVKYMADGSLDKAPNNMSMAGRIPGCIQCHQAADGNDWSFANDE